MKYLIHRYTERLQVWISYRLPRWLIMRASIRMIAHATCGKYSNQVVPELTTMEALKRWDAK